MDTNYYILATYILDGMVWYPNGKYMEIKYTIINIASQNDKEQTEQMAEEVMELNCHTNKRG